MAGPVATFSLASPQLSHYFATASAHQTSIYTSVCARDEVVDNQITEIPIRAEQAPGWINEPITALFLTLFGTGLAVALVISTALLTLGGA